MAAIFLRRRILFAILEVFDGAPPAVGGRLLAVEHPTTTLEELFLNIVRESQERPGRRATVSSGTGAGEDDASGR